MTMQILSRPRLSKIIDDLKLYPEQSEEMTREEVIEYMRKRIQVVPVLPELETQSQIALRRQNVDYEINTFQLVFVNESAKTAADVANRLANDFIEEHIKERVQVSGDTSEFIESELQRLATRIQQVEAQVAQVKSENPGRLPEDMDANQRLLERGIDDLRVVQRELAEAQSDEAFYKQQSLVSATTPIANEQTSPTVRLETLRQLLGKLPSTRLHGQAPRRHGDAGRDRGSRAADRGNPGLMTRLRCSQSRSRTQRPSGGARRCGSCPPRRP